MDKVNYTYHSLVTNNTIYSTSNYLNVHPLVYQVGVSNNQLPLPSEDKFLAFANCRTHSFNNTFKGSFVPYTSYDDSGNIGYVQRQKITSNNSGIPGYGHSLLFRSLNGAGINTQQKIWITVDLTVTYHKFDGMYTDPVLKIN